MELRPALIVSRPLGAATVPLHYALMITSAANRRWPDDISLEDDHALFGLPRPSLIRMAKIASIAADGVTFIGQLNGAKLAAVREALQRTVDIIPPLSLPR